jgi:formate hydrogenlyase transcriptional activator
LRQGSKEKDAYSEDEIRFLSVVADMIASTVDDAINFDVLWRTQDELRVETDRLQFLLELAGQIASNLELRELLRTLSATVRRVMRCDAVVVHLPDEERGSLRVFTLDLHECRNVLADTSWVEKSSSDGYISEVFRTRRPMVNTQGAPDSHPVILGEELRYACSVPLSRNRVLGVMELRREDYGFTQENANFLMQRANHVAVTIETSLHLARERAQEHACQRKAIRREEIRSKQVLKESSGGAPQSVLCCARSKPLPPQIPPY